VDGCIGVGVKDGLGDAVAVPQVDENDSAQIAAAMYPAHQQGAPAGVGRAKLSTRVCAFEVAEEV
jgi:hypothetical protein